MSTAQQLQEAADKATKASSQAKTWSSGPINTTVPTDSGPVPTIAEFIRANQVRADNAINAIGWVLAGNFTAGCTVTERNQYVLEVGGSTYRWDGALPKVVPPGSAPSPEAPGSWVRVLFVSDTPPLPDVWAPLSDSLRLITGYGRDVLVGSDVVARMVNFSRNSTATYIGKDGQLKTAAANEPRFEKEGLLIEGQSTNMVVRSEILPRMLEAGAYTISPSAVQGYNLHSCVYNSGDDALVVETGATLQAADGTGSFAFNSATIVGNWSCHFNNTDNYVGFWPKNSSAFEYEDLGKGLIRASRKLKGTTLNTLHFRCVQVAGSRIDIGCYQIEAIPFASSYIPTNGAAVTRAADIASLPQSLNLGEIQLGFSLAVDFDSVNPGEYRVISLSDYSAVIGYGANIYIRHAGREIGPLPIQLGKRNRLAYTVGLSGAITACINGVQITAQSRIAAGPRSNEKIMFGNYINTALNLALEGHLRDLKIWTKTPLTVEQLKAASA